MLSSSIVYIIRHKSFDYMEEIDFEIGHFISQLSHLHDFDLDLGSGHTSYSRESLIDLCLHVHNKFHWNRKKRFVADGRTDIETRLFHYVYSVEST